MRAENELHREPLGGMPGFTFVTVPFILVPPIAGVTVDRYNRKLTGERLGVVLATTAILRLQGRRRAGELVARGRRGHLRRERLVPAAGVHGCG